MVKISVRPDAPDMLSHHIEKHDTGQRTQTGEPIFAHTAIFDYPDCTRSFDGSRWRVTAKQPTVA